MERNCCRPLCRCIRFGVVYIVSSMYIAKYVIKYSRKVVWGTGGEIKERQSSVTHVRREKKGKGSAERSGCAVLQLILQLLMVPVNG